jgi:outer membrane protein insertion porin family
MLAPGIPTHKCRQRALPCGPFSAAAISIGTSAVTVVRAEEGPQYRFGTVDVQSSVLAIDPSSVHDKLRTSPGNVYNADAVEKTVEDLTILVTKRGYPFAVVRPREDRDDHKRVNLVYAIEEGPYVYVERINIRGNTRIPDYVIRREFNFGEGDAYNRPLVDRGEQRLRNFYFFKTVKLSIEPGSTPEHVIINVDVEERLNK